MVKFKFQFIVPDEVRPNKRCHSEPVCGLVRNDISIGMLNPNFANKKDAGARVLLYQSKKSFRTSLNFLRLGVSILAAGLSARYPRLMVKNLKKLLIAESLRAFDAH